MIVDRHLKAGIVQQPRDNGSGNRPQDMHHPLDEHRLVERAFDIFAEELRRQGGLKSVVSEFVV